MDLEKSKLPDWMPTQADVDAVNEAHRIMFDGLTAEELAIEYQRFYDVTDSDDEECELPEDFDPIRPREGTIPAELLNSHAAHNHPHFVEYLINHQPSCSKCLRKMWPTGRGDSWLWQCYPCCQIIDGPDHYEEFVSSNPLLEQ